MQKLPVAEGARHVVVYSGALRVGGWAVGTGCGNCIASVLAMDSIEITGPVFISDTYNTRDQTATQNFSNSSKATLFLGAYKFWTFFGPE